MSVEDLVSDVAFDLFRTRDLIPETEFHGKDLFHGKAAFKGWKVDDRLAVFDRLLAIIEDEALVTRVYAAVKPSNSMPTRRHHASRLATSSNASRWRLRQVRRES